MKAIIEPNQISVDVAEDIRLGYDRQFNTLTLVRVSNAETIRTWSVASDLTVTTFLNEVFHFRTLFSKN